MLIFAMQDKKTGLFLMPFFQVSRGQALRSVADSLEDKSQVSGKHPEDFRLFELGTFDDESGQLVMEQEFVCEAADLLPENSHGKLSEVKNVGIQSVGPAH